MTDTGFGRSVLIDHHPIDAAVDLTLAPVPERADSGYRLTADCRIRGRLRQVECDLPGVRAVQSSAAITKASSRSRRASSRASFALLADRRATAPAGFRTGISSPIAIASSTRLRPPALAR